MNLSEKASEVNDFLAKELSRYHKPVFYCSFGKDSTVLLHILRTSGRPLPPIVFYQDPWFPRKYDFARDLISAWNLEVYDYPPIRTSLAYGNGLAAFVNDYQSSPITTTTVPKNIVEYEDGEDPDRYLCGVHFVTRPVGTFKFPWDIVLIAHKNCDTDQICGPIPLEARLLYRDIGPDFIYPLDSWTHDDVWDYIEAFKVPYQKDRYDLSNRCEWEDKTYNSDYWHACIRCIDKRRAGEIVFCPKLKTRIQNMSYLVLESELNYPEIVKNGT